MSISTSGPASAGAALCLLSEDRLVRLSAAEYDLAAILEFDPEASIAPGSLSEEWGLRLTCELAVSHFSLETWRRLVHGFGVLGDPVASGDLRVWRFLERRRVAPVE